MSAKFSRCVIRMDLRVAVLADFYTLPHKDPRWWRPYYILSADESYLEYHELKPGTDTGHLSMCIKEQHVFVPEDRDKLNTVFPYTVVPENPNYYKPENVSGN